MPDIVPPASSSLPKIIPPTHPAGPPASWKAEHARQAPQIPPTPSVGQALATPPPAGPLVPPSAANPTRDPRTIGANPPVPQQDPDRPDRPDHPGVPEPEPPDIELPELSDEAVTFMTSPRYRESGEGLVRDFNLTPDDLSFLNEMDHFVLGGTIKLDGYVRALRQEFPSLAADKKDALIARLIAERFLPWDTVLKPTAQEVARSAGLRLPGVAYYAVYPKPLTFGGAAGEVARMADIPLTGPTRERLRDLVMSRAKGIRVDTQVTEQLVRPVDLGGLGLGTEKAQKTLQSIIDIVGRAKLLTEDEYSRWLAEQAKGRAGGQAGIQDPNARTPERPSDVDEDAKEIEAIAKKMPQPVRDTSSVLALSTQTLVNRLSVKPAGDYLMRRLENIVSTRLRDVRSRQEVLSKLMRDEKVGGLGLDRGRAEKAASEIEEGYAEFHGLIAQEEKEKMAILTQEQSQKIEERKKRDQEAHARWFKERIQGQTAEAEMKKQAFERFRVAAQGGLTNPIVTPPHPVEVKERAREREQLGDLVPAAPSSTRSQPRTEPKKEIERKTDAAATGASTISAPTGSRPSPFLPEVPQPTSTTLPTIIPPVTRNDQPVKVSAATAEAARRDSLALRPRMDDVRVFQTHLAGPMQEIAELTLSSFRRLGKTPEEAIAQVESKIELLGQESFERRIQGIQAWQGSPLQRAYLTLVAEAFSTGTPVNGLAAQKRAAGQDVPSPEEVAAIVALNGRLHF